MRKAILFTAFLAVIGALFADGSSGDFLLSPENTTTTTKQFGNSSDTIERGGWYFDGEKGYARQKGVGLRANSVGTLCFDFPEDSPEYITTLTVKCCTATAKSAAAENTLAYTLVSAEGVDQNISGSASFTTNSTDDAAVMTLTFDATSATKGLRFSNPGSTIFELSSVMWSSTLPELKVHFPTLSKQELNVPFLISIHNVTGGTGTYPYLSIHFNGELYEYSYPQFPIALKVVSPSVSGDYPVTICVQDDGGNEKVITETVSVMPYAKPRNVQVSNITRDSFDFTWEMSSGATPVSYVFKIEENREESSAQAIVTPKWVQASPNEWQTEVPIDLTSWTDGLAVNGVYLIAHGYTGVISYSWDNGQTWTMRPAIGGRYILGSIGARASHEIHLKTTSTPPTYLTFDLQRISGFKREETFAATAQKRIYSVADLPSGTSFKCYLYAQFEKIDAEASTGSQLVQYVSDAFFVQTLSISGFADVKTLPKWQLLQLTWPSDEANLSGEVRVFSETSLAHEIPNGLYLSRILWTKSGGGLTTAKAIALTNVSDRPIHLRGNYKLKSVKRDTGTTRTWDFKHASNDAVSTYPYVIPAGGELILAYENYPPSDLRDEVVLASASALNFTGDWDLSLYLDEQLCNTLTPQANAVIRLQEDSLTETSVSAITADMPVLEDFYQPWMKTVSQQMLGKTILSQDSARSILLDYSFYLTQLETTRKVWAVCRTSDGESYSTPIEILLWEPQRLPGFMLRMR